MRKKTLLYVGFFRDNKIPIRINPKHSILSITSIPCIECGGTGVWDYYPDDYEHVHGDTVCVVCKGTGKILINC